MIHEKKLQREHWSLEWETWSRYHYRASRMGFLLVDHEHVDLVDLMGLMMVYWTGLSLVSLLEWRLFG